LSSFWPEIYSKSANNGLLGRAVEVHSATNPMAEPHFRVDLVLFQDSTVPAISALLVVRLLNLLQSRKSRGDTLKISGSKSSNIRA